MSWVISGTQKIDPDAAVYLSRVEAADGQTLEPAVRTAVEAFIVGCKSDGIWNAIKASCILAGARTLTGALVPLVGTAPTNFNFVSGDYNRKTGLVGNGTTKYLNSNRNNNADPQDDRHLSVYMSTPPSSDGVVIMGCTGATGRSAFVKVGGTVIRLANSVGVPPNFATLASGFLGGTRTSASATQGRNGGQTITGSDVSQTPVSLNLGVFANESGGTAINARLAFYSIGESLDLALLDARVTTLINAFAAAIP
jgi:hypothetical protein